MKTNQKIPTTLGCLLFAALVLLAGCATYTGYAPLHYDPDQDPQGEQILTAAEYAALAPEEQEGYQEGTYRQIDPVTHKKIFQASQTAKNVIESGSPFLPSPIKEIALLLAAGLGAVGSTWQTLGKRKVWKGFRQAVQSVDKVLATTAAPDAATGLNLTAEQMVKIKAILAMVQDTETKALVDQVQAAGAISPAAEAA